MQDMMSSATSTTAQVNKRTHFDESNIKNTSPSKRSLQPTITSTLLKLSTHHIKLHMKVQHKATQKKRMMEDEEFIPCSACIKFTLTVSKEAEDDQEFKDLQETTKKNHLQLQKESQGTDS
eukprot:665263-Ditylum_brightwellii.AAC.1